MNYYRIKFRLAQEEKANTVSLSDYKQMFSDAEDDFNRSGEVARTYKKILLQEVYATYIEIVFECASPLTNPTMCFRNYSRFILDNNDLEDWVTKSGNFLKGIEAVEIQENELPVEHEPERNELTDKELIKSVIDLCLNDKIENAEEKKNRLRVIDKIKELVIEYNKL